jgi:polysaccharide biosynthesis/export protein
MLLSMIRGIIWLVAVVGLLSACVPNKRIVYLQHEPEPKRGTVSNADTLARTYTTRLANYTLKPRDIISVRVASITPGEFDFVKQYEEQLGLIRKLNQYDQGNKSGGAQQRLGGVGGQGEDGISPLMLDRQQTGFELDEEGNLELPFIGRLKLADLSIQQAERLIREKLQGYFETPVVRVQLLSFHFTILGEVNQEGRYTSFDPNTTIVDAIALANNLNDFADRSKIKVVRFEGDQATVFYVNLLREDLLAQPGFFVRPNDLVIVPPLEARATRRYTLPTTTTAISVVASTLSLVLVIISLNR